MKSRPEFNRNWPRPARVGSRGGRGGALRASAACVLGGLLATACTGSTPRQLACIAPLRSVSTLAHVSSISGENSIRRWADHDRTPVRVWVQPRSADTPLGADTLTRSMIQRAFNAWRPSGIPVRTEIVDTRSDADILVTFIDHFRSTIDGYTVVTWDCGGSITHGVVQLALRKPDGRALGDSMRLAIAIHEAGHALGLGHSRDTTDVMSPLIHVTHPSAADFAMLRGIYMSHRESAPAERVAAVTW